MDITAKQKKHTKGYLLIFFCFLLYTCSYLGKYGYNANINLIINDYGVSNADAGLVSTCFFFAYGFGQILNGLLCKHYNKRIVLPLALIVSAILNIVFINITDFRFLKYIWLFNGFSLSFLWSSMLMLLGEKLPGKSLSKAVLVMAMPTPVGILITYGLSALLVEYNVYKIIFYIAGGVLAIVSILFFIFYNKITDIEKDENTEKETKEKDEKIAKGFLISSTILVVVFLGVVALLNKYMDDGIVLWLPKILVDSFHMSDSISIVVTMVFPIFGILASFVNVFLNKKISDLLVMIGLYLVVGLACTILLYYFGNIHWALKFVLFIVLYFMTNCVGGIVSTMAPLYMRGKINSGLLGGLLNGCCYMGSAISAYTLGLVSDNFGWNGAYLLFIIMCSSCIGVVVIYFLLSIFLKPKHSLKK